MSANTAAPSYTFIMVHGAWQGAWHDAIAADMPGDGHDDTPPGEVNLARYAEKLTRLIDATSGPIVMLGHSMGGISASQVSELRPERVALAIYVCAFMLPDDFSVLEFYEKYLEPWMRGAHARVTYDTVNQTSMIDPVSAVEVFYQLSDPAVAKAAAARLTPQPEGARRSKLHLSPEKYGSVPRVYIEALQDRSVHLPLQRKMQEITTCDAVYALDSDHAPQLSMPDALTDMILSVTARHARTI